MKKMTTLILAAALCTVLCPGVLGASINCPSTEYCEFEIVLKARTDWSTFVNTTFIGDLAYATNNNADLFSNMTKIFDTIIVGTLAFSSSQNASLIALDIVQQINAVTANVQSFCSKYSVLRASYGYTPVVVPLYLRIPDEPDQMVFVGLGAVAAFLVVLQFVYGFCHFRGFGFITVEKGERD